MLLRASKFLLEAIGALLAGLALLVGFVAWRLAYEGPIHLRFLITACGGRPVQGASVFATAVPYNQFAAAQATTASNGTVVLTESRQAGFPVSRQQRLLAVFARAWTQGEPVTGGVSSSKVVAFRLHRR